RARCPERAHLESRRGRSAAKRNRRRRAGRGAHLVSRSLAQEAPPQAPADPACFRGTAGDARETGRSVAPRDRLARVCFAHAGSAESKRPDWRIETRFERRGIDLGHPVTDLLYDRVSPSYDPGLLPPCVKGAPTLACKR